MRSQPPVSAIPAFWRLLATAPRGRLLLLLGLMVLSGISEGVGFLLLIPLLDLVGSTPGDATAHGWNRALTSSGIPTTLPAVLTLFVLVVTARNVVQYARERLGTSLQFLFVDRLREQCVTALLKAEWRWIVGKRRADHASLLLTDVNRVGVGVNAAFALLAGSATMLASLAAALVVSWKFAALAVVSGGAVFLSLARQRRKALQLGRRIGESNRALHANVQHSLAGIKLAKVLGTERAHRDDILATSQGLRDHQLAFTAGASLSKAFFQTAGAVLLALYVYVGLTVWQVPMAELLMLVAVFARLLPMFAGLQQQAHLWLHSLPAFTEAERLLDECRRVEQPDGEASGPPLRPRDAIVLKDISLRYDGRRQTALRALSLRFPIGTTTAIVGASGAGKSTLADLLAGLLVPQSGTVEADGVALTGKARAQWRQVVAYVPQDLFLLNDTIRANLQWACPGASDAALRQALEKAAADFVFRLPEGLDTVVGDGAGRLSGGERQRIALARALLREPDILILDEATSALDIESEQRVQAALDALRGRMTIFIVGHRLLSLERADLVVALRDGAVVSQGPWLEVAGAMPFDGPAHARPEHSEARR